MSLMQGKPCSLFPGARDIPRAGNFPGLRMLVEAQTLAKAWREVKEKLLNNPSRAMVMTVGLRRSWGLVLAMTLLH